MGTRTLVPAAATDTGALAKELRAAVRGEVRFGNADRALYAYDASVYRQVPIGAVIPRDADDVAAALAVCRAHDVPVFGRGCGTGLAGQTVNAAVIFDFSKYMTAIETLDPMTRTARVQPGVICDTLRDAAQPHGLTFGPDPATHDHATLGGMIGNNSCGTHSVMAGKTVDNIDELDVITYDGTRMRLGATSDADLERIIATGGRRGGVYARLTRIRDEYADAIRQMPDIPRRVSGYNLDQLLPENGFNVARALVGSESTCALTVGATCRLVHSPPHRSTVVLGYDDLPSSGDDVPWLLGFGPIGLEFNGRKVLEHLHAKEFDFGGDELLPPASAGWLLVEFGGETKQEADEKAEGMFAELERRPHPPPHRLYEDSQSETAVWEARKTSVGSTRLPLGLGGHPGWPNWEDAAVAPERLGDYLRDYEKLLTRHHYDGVIFGHWGHGCVHCRIDFDLRSTRGIRDFRRFMEEAADLVVSHGGSLSGEHGDGHGRAELWPKMFSPELMRAFDEFKHIWDPDDRLNPRKLIDPYPLDSHLREGAAYRPRQLRTVFKYPEDGGDFAEAAGRCFGVGACRHLSGGVMCPSYMVTREEKHSTRGRARLLQEMSRADGPIERRWRADEVRESLELCLACKGCRGECPVRVDIATYKAEFLHHHYRRRLRPRQAYALGLINTWARLAAHTPRLANALVNGPGIGRLVKLAGGVAQQRQPPRFAQQTLRAWFAEHQPRHPEGQPVLLWPDTFTNYFEPEVGIAAVHVLEAAGWRVQLPDRVLCCGRPLYDYGMLTLARRYLRRVLDGTREQIRAGTPLVGLEPSCIAVFRDELTNLFPRDADAQRLHDQAVTLAEFLTGQGSDWPLPRLHRHALVQPHCHHQAVMGFGAEQDVLHRIGLDVEQPDAGCCGMAGSFGYEAGEKYEVSMAAGERVLLPAVRAAAADTLVLADGFSCRSQIAAGSDRTALHLAQVLELALHEGVGAPIR